MLTFAGKNTIVAPLSIKAYASGGLKSTSCRTPGCSKGAAQIQKKLTMADCLAGSRSYFRMPHL